MPWFFLLGCCSGGDRQLTEKSGEAIHRGANQHSQNRRCWAVARVVCLHATVETSSSSSTAQKKKEPRDEWPLPFIAPLRGPLLQPLDYL